MEFAQINFVLMAVLLCLFDLAFSSGSVLHYANMSYAWSAERQIVGPNY
jgi:hypothetical protein